MHFCIVGRFCFVYGLHAFGVIGGQFVRQFALRFLYITSTFPVSLHCLLCMNSDSTSLKGILLSAARAFFIYTLLDAVSGFWGL